jgi:hypothetical protein
MLDRPPFPSPGDTHTCIGDHIVASQTRAHCNRSPIFNLSPF